MSYEFYKVLHVIGLMFVFISVGGYLIAGLNKHSKQDFKARGWVSSLHGIGVLLLLVAGFGMLAKNKIPWEPFNWVGIKTYIWIFLGMFPMLAFKQQARIRTWMLLSLILGATAIYLGIHKPF